MRPLRTLFAGIFVAMSLCAPAAPALAHGPTRQKVAETVDINAPPSKVWAVIKNFDAIAKWHPAVASSPADKGDEVGSVRVLTLKAPGDPKIIEELVAFDDAARKYQYSIKQVDVKVLPVTNYMSWLSVADDGKGGSKVEWRGAFYRGYPNNDPPPELNDEAAVKAVTGVYRGGLDNLKKMIESP